MNLNDTPRTYAAWNNPKTKASEFARELERELNRQYEENVSLIARQAKTELERDSWKSCAEKLYRTGPASCAEDESAFAEFEKLKGNQ